MVVGCGICGKERAIMKNILSIAKVQPDVRGWTALIQEVALIQVVERGHILVSQKDPTVSYRKFLFVDVEGTKVSAVAYNNNIRPSSTLLLPFKRYYVSGATLKRVDEKYRVGDYEFSWTITNTTLIQPCEEQIVPQMYGHIELQQFAIYIVLLIQITYKVNVLGVVAYAFEEKQIGFDSVNRDILIVNEENMPIMLTLWNDFATTEGAQLATAINVGNVILAMRVRVTTYNGISLSTRAQSAIMINPPLPEVTTLKQWYITNKVEIGQLIFAGAYKDISALLLPPMPDRIITLQTLIDPERNDSFPGSISQGRRFGILLRY
ncbi:replication protein A 70 kDa DNA-binding subunit [Striga asiatica]|uniref:Replication protein A 70 kDa DNA-binding subunit n=1 Tax=Striga asiatica TaxID=4170 RepID=A0A5A7Q4C8_STRAF|nr:replication protein A 70 kDa DNA-binding subunit [Striga asiatica]